MTFTSLPEMFSSVFGPLAYTFSNAAETELFLEILSTRDGSRIGSKRFYNTCLLYTSPSPRDRG
mgnify:FL=1